jgi:hypothetical protein
MKHVLALAAAAALVVAVPAASAAAPPTGSFSTTIAGQMNMQLNGSWQLRLLPGSRYAVVKDGAVVVRGTGARTAKRLTFRDTGGPAACRGAGSTGVYTWKLAGRTLTLAAVSDTCTGRRAVLTTHPLVRG